ncbi:MAG: hypothetical protein KC996_08260 [Phycisphaerales bacterium]|nr:hypothetical protein [Phycisphaerales bacterium]
MTSAQTMLASAILAATLLLSGFGCASPDRREVLSPPGVIVAPYDTSEGDLLWAVLPPVNESGTSFADPLEVGDDIVASVQGIRGVRCVPLNRAIEAIRFLGLENGIADTSDAIRVAEYLGVDGVIASSITAYDPYDPPTLGLALALYARPGQMARGTQAVLDPKSLSMAYTDFGRADTMRFGGEPVSVVSEHLDARNHEVLMSVRNYATGRSDPTSALGWRSYTASMELYTQFAAHHCVGRLIDEEWLRLARQKRNGSFRTTP